MISVSVFIQILNMSLGAAWAALLVMAARLLLRRCSHGYSYALWGLVLFRMACPVSFSSVLSLMPRPQAIPQQIVYAQTPRVESGFVWLDQTVSSVLPPATPYASANPVQIWLEIGNILWQAGVVVLLLYCLISYLHFLGKLRGAVLIQDHGGEGELPEKATVWESDRIPTAFVLGMLRPKIYLPIGVGAEERKYILCHEQTHIRRLDHVVKPLALLLLIVHWFNPVLWLAWFLMLRDMEMSCDELALKKLGPETRKGYTSCLLTLSVRRSGLAVPLAFGENSVKSRIVNILRYKKPALWVTVGAVALAAVLGFCLLSNPREDVGAELFSDPDLAGEYPVTFLEVQQGSPLNHHGIAPSSYITVTDPEVGTRLASLLLDGTPMQDIPGQFPPTKNYLQIIMGDPGAVYYVYEHQGGYFMERPEDYRLSLSKKVYREIMTVWGTVSQQQLPVDEADLLQGIAGDREGYYTGFEETVGGAPRERYLSFMPETATKLAALILSGTETDLEDFQVDAIALTDFLRIEIRDQENVYYVFLYEGRYFVIKPGEYISELTRDAYEQIRNIYIDEGANYNLSRRALSFHADGDDMADIARVGVERYYGAYTDDGIPDELRLLDFTINDITPIAGTMEEFLVAVRWDYDTPENTHWISANGDSQRTEDPPGWRWTDNYTQFRFRRVQNGVTGIYALVGVGTGGGGQGLEPLP